MCTREKKEKEKEIDKRKMRKNREIVKQRIKEIQGERRESHSERI